MLRLTREVRFALRPDGSLPPDGGNGFAGRPSLDGLGFHFELRVSLAGDVDPSSSYLRNIVEVDRAVRSRGIPVVQHAIAEKRFDDVTGLVLRLHAALRDVTPAWHLDAVELRLSPFLSYTTYTREMGMVRLSQRFEFSASHRLHNPALSDADNVVLFGKCNNPAGHGHNYEVQVTVAGGGDSPPLLPVHELERLVDARAIAYLDHKHLNEQVPEFADLNPSVENIAKVIYRKLKPHVRGLAGVTVWETPKTSAEYSE